MAPRFTFHLIGNAHLDPVWLWNWREGLNEAIITSRAILDLMDEFPELTFVRGEALLYRHIEEHDPQTFARIRRRVADGRWDVAGGTHIQPDTNLTGTETLCRHFARSQAYFRSRFGRAAEIAWAADSFGHSAGLPDILAEAGMRGFAFTRPSGAQVALARPAFWWEGGAGNRILAYRPCPGWYGCEREEMPRRLDGVLAMAETSGLHHVGVFYGLGDHGGGPTRRTLRDIAAWADAHPEIAVVHSGLHPFFAALRRELESKGDEGFLPVHRGELNFCLRGCYVSVAKLKTAFRATEALLTRAEATDSALAAALATPPSELGPAWDAVLINSFHDILPGSSIESAVEEQLAWLGLARHLALAAENRALNRLARAVDTTRSREPAGDMPGSAVQLVWNPHPWTYRGPVELEASLDYRPIWAYRGRSAALPLAVRGPDGALLPHQVVETEHSSMPQLPWRKRVIVPATLPPLGWTVMEMAWEEGTRTPSRADSPTAAVSPGAGRIGNGVLTLEARAGETGVHIQRNGKPILRAEGLGVVTVEDPWGSWGGMGEEPESLDLSSVRQRWTIDRVDVLEPGPERALLAVRFVGGHSRLDLRFALLHSRAVVEATARLFLDERSARLKLCLPAGGTEAEFEVPGGVVRRGPAGEVPGGRWVRLRTPRGLFGFASNALYGFDLKDGVLRASMARASRYANDVRTPPEGDPWRPVVDTGELTFRFLLAAGREAGRELPRLARELELPPVTACVAPSPGNLPRTGSLGGVRPESLQLLALKPAEDGRGWVLRLQETAGRTATATLTWLGQVLRLGPVPARAIATWRLVQEGGVWRAVRVSAQEL
ncbi:MAG: glycoside hydrolase family 38 [Lentisphaeria bacterium]|nr:glycoside hydrolase family 38 [Lentisphaeria bacterium]